MDPGGPELKTEVFYPHTIFCGMETPEEEGQGGGRGVTSTHTRTHTHTHTHTHRHTLLTYHTQRSQYYPGVLSHTFWSSREPNKNTNLTSCSLQVDAFKFTSETVM